jgi:hypothetical protein
MSEVTYKILRKTYLDAYQKALRHVNRLSNEDKLERALRHAEYAASIAWHRPILPDFIDSHLETEIEKIAANFIETYTFPRQARGDQCKRAVLYNGQIIDTGALTEQYLNYLIDNNYEVLFLVQDVRNTVKGQKILQRLELLSNVKVVILDSGSHISKIRQLHQTIIGFDPDFSFLHFLPNDIVGYAAFSKLVGRPRYFIVHNDHTFWVGKGCSDYFLEFRQLGARLTIERRGIPSSQIVKVPFYPIHSTVSFQGLPFDPSDKVVGLSGALLSKYFRDPELKYFQSIKKLLYTHEDFVFCLCGTGTVEEVEWINRFIRSNDLEDRFFYLGGRDDFFELVGKVDILFESFPQIGCLVVLFATTQGKAVVGIGSKESYPGTTSQFLDIENYQQPLTFEEFEAEATRLIDDKDYRIENARKFSDTLYNKKSFYANLAQLVDLGFSYQEELSYKKKKIVTKFENYDIELNKEQNVTEFLLRLKYRAYFYGKLMGRLCDVILTLRFNGLKILMRRVQKKIGC